VSNAGGYGVLGMAGRSPDFIRDEMRKVKSLTDKPFGVDLLAASPESLTASVEIIIEEGASSFVAGPWRADADHGTAEGRGPQGHGGLRAVKHAVKAEQAGCDAVICQGGEGGGHTGLVGTMPLVAQAVEAVKIPVVAAGGLYDGRGLAAALSLGAVGVWMGTRFIASPEAHAGQMYRDTIVEATDEDTVRTRSYSGKPMRVKKNPTSRNGKRGRRTSSPSRCRRCFQPRGRHGRHRRPDRGARPRPFLLAWAIRAACTTSCRPRDVAGHAKPSLDRRVAALPSEPEPGRRAGGHQPPRLPTPGREPTPSGRQHDRR
jgi:NAD(P)H-dependent flavin oxidoreductase YrpB (nitropropane dioxygenase family)